MALPRVDGARREKGLAALERAVRAGTLLAGLPVRTPMAQRRRKGAERKIAHERIDILFHLAETEAGPGSVARRHVDLPRLAGHVLPEFEDPQGQQEEDQARCEEDGEDLDVAEEPEPAANRVRREDEPAGEVEPVRERDSPAE